MVFVCDMNGKKIDKEGVDIWFHGSQIKMTVLRSGSSITRNKDLAIAFSHRPTQVSVDDDGKINHKGKENGYLYIIDEEVNDKKVKVHEACKPDDQWEWITTKDLKIKLIEET